MRFFESHKIHWMDCFIIFATTLVVVNAFGLLVVKPFFERTSLVGFTLPLLVQLLVMLGLTLFFVIKVRQNSVQETLMLRGVSIKTALRCALYGVGLFILALSIGMVTNKLLANGIPQQNVESLFNAEPRSLAFLLSLLFVGILAPAVEEIFFRGYLFNALRPALGLNANMLITSAIFSATHWDPYRFVGLFVGGYLLNRIAVKENSIVASMIAHSVWNICMVLLAFFALYAKAHV